MRNIFADGSSKNGFSISSPTVGGFRPVKLGQVTSEAMSPARMPHTMGPNDMPQGHPEETKPAVMPATVSRTSSASGDSSATKRRFSTSAVIAVPIIDITKPATKIEKTRPMPFIGVPPCSPLGSHHRV